MYNPDFATDREKVSGYRIFFAMGEREREKGAAAS